MAARSVSFRPSRRLPAIAASLLIGPLAAALPAQNAGLDWMRFLGGAADEVPGWPNGLAVAPNGELWVGGQDDDTAPAQAMLTRLAANGAVLTSFLLGGNGISRANAVAVDATGAFAYVAGRTTSTTFPVTGNALQPAPAGGHDMFLAVLDVARGVVVYATYLGGPGDDIATDLAVDTQGRAWMLGSTTAAGFPVTANAFQATFGGVEDAVLACVDPFAAGSAQLVYGTLFGGPAQEATTDLAIDVAGRLAFACTVAGPGLPTTPNAFQPAFGGGAFDAFVAQLQVGPTSTQLVYGTFFGGSGDDNGNALSLDGAIATLGGWTTSPNLPVTVLPPAIQPTKSGVHDAYVVQFRLSAGSPSVLFYGTYLGGAANDGVNDLVVDAGGDITIVGTGGSTDYPLTPGSFRHPQPQTTTGARAIVSRIDPVAGRLLYSTALVDASGHTQGWVARPDGLGGIHLLGRTQAAALPVTMPPPHGGGWDLLVAHWNLLPQGAARSGQPIPGLGGETSFLGVTEQPRSGATAFALTAGDLPTMGTIGIRLAGFRLGTTPTPFGSLLLAQPWCWGVGFLGYGPRASWPVPLAGVPAGTSLAFEVVLLDTTRNALSATNALTITVQ